MGELLNRRLWRQFLTIAAPYWLSEKRGEALRLLACLLLLRVGVTGLNVAISLVAGAFMTAYQGKDVLAFYQDLALYFSVFVIGTPLVAFYSYSLDLLFGRWRTWLTEHMLERYFARRAYYHVKEGGVIDNPEERLQQNIRDFCLMTLVIMLVVVRCIIVLLSFGFLLWHISPTLMLIVLGYALAGSIAVERVGRKVFVLKQMQLKKEATFRYSLTHVGSNSESIAFYQGEEQEFRGVSRRFFDAIANADVILGWQRRVNFLGTAYANFIVLVPFIVIAPQFFSSQVPFGTLASASIAFAQIVQALSAIVKQFDNFTDFAAQIERLGSFYEEMGQCGQANRPNVGGVVGPRIELEHVTLKTPDGSRTLLNDLSLVVEAGTGLIVVGPSGSGKSSLLRFLGGLWKPAQGSLSGPRLAEVLFLPQRPYMTIGSLRAQLIYPQVCCTATDEELQRVLEQVNLPELAGRVGGFDAELNFAQVLSLGEQQRLAFGRLILSGRKYVVLDESTSALDPENQDKLYRLLRNTGSTFISVAHRPSVVPYHDQVLELLGDGGWRAMPLAAYVSAHEFDLEPTLAQLGCEPSPEEPESKPDRKI